MKEHRELLPAQPEPSLSACNTDVEQPGILARGLLIAAGQPAETVQAIGPASAAPPHDDREVIVEHHDMDFFIRLAWEADGWTVAVDEAPDFWRSHGEELTRLVRTMRHRHQDIWFSGQRTVMTPHGILSQVDRLLVFCMTWTPDLDVLRNWFHVTDDDVMGLGVGEFIDKEISPRATWQRCGQWTGSAKI